jgi:hypothetical protein
MVTRPAFTPAARAMLRMGAFMARFDEVVACGLAAGIASRGERPGPGAAAAPPAGCAAAPALGTGWAAARWLGSLTETERVTSELSLRT